MTALLNQTMIFISKYVFKRIKTDQSSLFGRNVPSFTSNLRVYENNSNSSYHQAIYTPTKTAHSLLNQNPQKNSRLPEIPTNKNVFSTLKKKEKKTQPKLDQRRHVRYSYARLSHAEPAGWFTRRLLIRFRKERERELLMRGQESHAKSPRSAGSERGGRLTRARSEWVWRAMAARRRCMESRRVGERLFAQRFFRWRSRYRFW